MHERYRQRKRAATRSLTGTEKRLSLMSPIFNMREIAKQLLLLEDHLAHGYKRCPDCIRKHLLTAEALAEEAVALDPLGLWARGCEMTAELFRRWLEKFIDAQDVGTWANLGQSVRELRKHLTEMVADPRGSIDRVASAYLARCPYSHKVGTATPIGTLAAVQTPGTFNSRTEYWLLVKPIFSQPAWQRIDLYRNRGLIYAKEIYPGRLTLDGLQARGTLSIYMKGISSSGALSHPIHMTALPLGASLVHTGFPDWRATKVQDNRWKDESGTYEEKFFGGMLDHPGMTIRSF